MESEEKVITVDDDGKIRTRRASSSSSSSSPLEYQGVLKAPAPPTNANGLRTIKSLSGLIFKSLVDFDWFPFIDTISIQKKIIGTDRLKRLDSSTSLFQRQTSLLGKKMTSLANKLVNPFAIIKKKVEPVTTTTTADNQVDLRTNMKRQISIIENNNDVRITSQRTVTISPLKRTREDDDEEEDNQPQARRKVQILSVNQEIRRPTALFSYDEEEAKRNGEILLNNFYLKYLSIVF